MGAAEMRWEACHLPHTATAALVVVLCRTAAAAMAFAGTTRFLRFRPFCLLCRAMAELLMAAVSRGVRAAAAREHMAAQQQHWGGGRGRLVTSALTRVPRPLPPLPPLPPPMVTDNYEANATSCHMQVHFGDGFVVA